jgi:hypothetical protein
MVGMDRRVSNDVQEGERDEEDGERERKRWKEKRKREGRQESGQP